MGINNFSKKQCIKVLNKLGFTLITNCRGKHDKYIAPENIKSSNNIPFIIIPRHNELHCQNAIIKELRAMGGDNLIKKFRDYL